MTLSLSLAMRLRPVGGDPAHLCIGRSLRAVSSSNADRDEALLLLRKAREDQAVVAKLVSDREIADAAIGFHAQQAVEKALKAILAAAGYEFPWTHDIRHLLERLGAIGVAVPDSVREARWLSPWAVEFRYGETIDDTLDRDATSRLVREVVRWAAREAGVEPDG